MKFIEKSYSLYTKDIHNVWCRSGKFLWKSKFCSRTGFGSGSWFHFGFQYQAYISYMEDTYQILFGPANSFESYCVYMKSPRMYVHPNRQTDRQTEILFCSFCLLTYTKHEHSSKGENFFFFFTHAITILSLFTYSVCDEKVKINVFISYRKKNGTLITLSPFFFKFIYIFIFNFVSEVFKNFS